MSTVVITGGSRGIGAAAVKLFAEKGYRVFFLYEKEHEAAQAVAEKTGATAICCDVADGQAVKAAFENIPDVRLNLIGRLLLFLTALNGVFEGPNADGIQDNSLSGQVVRYVNSQLFTPLSLQTVADHFYRSRSQISRIFHQATGSSFWEYVSIKRLLAARAMIQRGEKASQAALVCGFTDYSVFYRAYKNHFGHSPKDDS